VVVADLLDSPGHAVVAEIVAAGGRAEFVHVDAASVSDNEAMADRAVRTFGGVDVLVTAAGISHGGYRSGDVAADAQRALEGLEYLDRPGWDVVDANIDEIATVLDVNLLGTLRAIQACARRMLTAGTAGSIVTIASVAAKHPDAGPLGYVLSKSAVWMLTKKLARSFGPAGIRVNAIGPGLIDTNMTAVLDLAPQRRDQVLAGIPIGRKGTPAEVASTALFLATDDSSYFTGALLHPDGGFFTG
jgi:3-oxoacyl-[acyl-carrier protein] reductase